MVDILSPILGGVRPENRSGGAVGPGLSVKEACAVATTADITLSGEQTIDGVLTSASRVLVKNQADPTENGIYVSGAGAWSRSADADDNGELQNGSLTLVLAGTANATKQFAISSPAGVVDIGTDAILWTQISAGANGVQSFNGRIGNVLPSGTDYDADDIAETATGKIMTAAERTKLAGLDDIDAALLQYGSDAGSPADVQVVGGSVVGNPALGTLVSATAHGFVTGDVLYVSAANTYAKARADAEATLGGYVCQKIDDDNFRLVQGGSLELSGLTATKTYYLSDSTAGLLVVEDSKPTASGSYLLSIGQAISTTTLVVMPQDAQEIA